MKMKMKMPVFLLLVVTVKMMLLPVVTPLNDEGQALKSIKASFSNVANVLLDWDDMRNDDHCSWRGVYCDNDSLSVISLNLSNLNLGGEISPSIGDLSNLQTIDLKGNHLTGQIPDEIGNCVALKTLDLSANSLYGDIPFSISKLKQLEELSLKSNQLTGPIPSTLSQIPNLKTLDLAQNQLTGEIPRLIYWNEVLQYLGLRGNSLTGVLSPDMCQLTGLWYFDVRGNNISGVIPESIGNCTSFEILDVSYNQISGKIPYNIGFLQVATLSLQGNRLTGKIPEVIGLMQALAVLDLSENDLVGPIPPILGNLSYTGKLYLHGNKLTGPIPPELGNMSKLSYLQLNDNQLVGRIPPELGKLEELFELNLANNHLEGPIPHNISSCTALNQLNVCGNKLSGSIPAGFQNLGSLTFLNFSSNDFRGRIPFELGRIINLDTLDLSSNNFSGSIPASVGDLEHLLTLNLSMNHLDGSVPAEFGNLRSIQILDLSFNNLSGKIPEELGQLQNLNSLILKNNDLHGEIPSQLTNCFSLDNLDLSYNNLSGHVPLSKNFSRFPSDSFTGNPLLCGDWFGSCFGTYARESKGLMSRAALILISLGCITLLLMVIVAIYRSNQSNHFLEGANNSFQGPPKMVILHMDMAIHSYEDIMSITENLNEKYIIGYGASSTVYKCVLKNSKPIAIKRLYTQHPHNVREFETELETIGSIKHRNLVSLHGYSLTPNGNLLFYEYMQNGSLWDLLHGPLKKVKLDWDARLKIAVGAAQGLAYLHHDCNPRIIHRDIKSSNILVDDNFEAHLSDFGIARCISSSKTHASTYVMGTIGYIDPEYARTSRLNEKSDVYSFGVVLLELLTGKKAVDNESNLHQLILSKADDNTVMEAVDPEVSVTCMDLNLVRKTFQLALLCTKRNPSERPTMHEVARVLVSLLPAPPAKSALVPKTINYTQLVSTTEANPKPDIQVVPEEDEEELQQQEKGGGEGASSKNKVGNKRTNNRPLKLKQHKNTTFNRQVSLETGFSVLDKESKDKSDEHRKMLSRNGRSLGGFGSNNRSEGIQRKGDFSMFRTKSTLNKQNSLLPNLRKDKSGNINGNYGMEFHKAVEGLGSGGGGGGGGFGDESVNKSVPAGRYFAALRGAELDQVKDSEDILLPKDEQWPFLLRFPIGCFGISLGLSSQAILWKRLSLSPATKFLHITPFINLLLWIVALAVLVCISITYTLKCIFYFEAVKREYFHPVRVNFFFAPWIVCMFLAIGAPPILFPEPLHPSIWCIFMTPVFFLELKIYGQWLSGGKRRLCKVANPSTHLSVVGNFVGSILASKVGWQEPAKFLWAIGFAHYLVVFVTLYQRLPTSEALPKELHPVYSMFIAAPSAASIAWFTIYGEFDGLARTCFFIALFLYISLVVRISFFWGFRFSVAWWSYTFPMTTVSLATIIYAEEVPCVLSKVIALSLSFMSSTMVSLLFVSTLLHAFVWRSLFPNDLAIAITKRRNNEGGKFFGKDKKPFKKAYDIRRWAKQSSISFGTSSVNKHGSGTKHSDDERSV